MDRGIGNGFLDGIENYNVKSQGTVDLQVLRMVQDDSWLPEWKRFLANLFNIPIERRYTYHIHGKVYGTDIHIEKNNIYRIEIDNGFVHFICKGTAKFASMTEYIFWTIHPIRPELDSDQYYKCPIHRLWIVKNS